MVFDICLCSLHRFSSMYIALLFPRFGESFLNAWSMCLVLRSHSRTHHVQPSCLITFAIDSRVLAHQKQTGGFLFVPRSVAITRGRAMDPRTPLVPPAPLPLFRRALPCLVSPPLSVLMSHVALIFYVAF